MDNSFELLCPACGNVLIGAERTFACSSGHSFDISKKGYVNLLLGASRGHHGDDKLMVRARTDFLSKGYYDRLSEAICLLADEVTESSPAIIDAGCGEGKYTADILRSLRTKGKTPAMLAVDISKDAVDALLRREKGLQAIVASTAALPVRDGAADLLVNIFSPFFRDEFRRVLKKGGVLIRVVPLKDHLYELKQLVYDHAYYNDVPDYEEPGFEIFQRQTVEYSITLSSNADIRSLFLMTPYYYKTGAEDQKKLETADHLDVKLQFGILCYQAV